MAELKEIVKNISNSSNNIKNNKKTEERCIAAIKITTIKGAWKLIDKGVVLVSEEINGVIKSIPFTQCNKNHLPGDNLCHIHNTQKKDINRINPVIFKDILPDNNVDTLSKKKNYIATGNEEYFKKINKKCVPEKKNSTSTSYDFKDNENPILMCINESPEILQELLFSAIKILQNNNIKITNNTLNKNNKKIDEKKLKSHNNSLLNTINALNELNNSSKNEETSISKKNPILLNETLLSNDNKVKKELDINDSDIEEESINDSDIEESNIEDEDEDEETECIEIYTKERVLLALDVNTNIVYKPEDDENYIELGKLTKIDEKYSTIEHDYQYWTIIKDIECPETGSDLKLCSLTNKVFNNDLVENIGKVTKNKNSSYKITIFKKKK